MRKMKKALAALFMTFLLGAVAVNLGFPVELVVPVAVLLGVLLLLLAMFSRV